MDRWSRNKFKIFMWAGLFLRPLFLLIQKIYGDKYLKVMFEHLILTFMEWVPGQYYEIKLNTKEKDGHILFYQGLERKQLTNRNKLRNESIKLFNKLVIAVQSAGIVKIKSFTFFVYYYDRFCFIKGNTILFKAYVTNEGKNMEFEEAPLISDNSNIGKIEKEQIIALRGYPLKNTQSFLIRYRKLKYQKKEKQTETNVISDEINETLCLLNICEGKFLSHTKGKKKEAKKQFADLCKYIIPGSPYKRVIIKYQLKADGGKAREYNFRISSQQRAPGLKDAKLVF